MEQRKIYGRYCPAYRGGISISGVVGPVRTGKSTFIKRFMETMVIPNIDNVYRRERARDELPQSGSGRTIMTAEPKFVPEEAVQVTMDNGAAFSVRLIDCVGYMVPGAVGSLEDDSPRMVTTPWFDYEIPMTEAAEIGTRKVIAEHSTIGIVVTTDGSITDIPREDYLEAEERVIAELKELGKPFLVVLNLRPYPNSERARAIRADIAQRHQVACVSANCLELGEEDISGLLKQVLYEFPPEGAGPVSAPLGGRTAPGAPHQGRPVRGHPAGGGAAPPHPGCGRGHWGHAGVRAGQPGPGDQHRRLARLAAAVLELPRALFYDTLSQQSGFQIGDDGDLMALLTQLAQVKAEYDKVADALKEVEETGYGIVVPSIDSLVLEEPEIVRQGGRYGVRLKASAPSIHMIRADIETEVSPIVGSEKQSEEMIHYLLQEFEGDTAKIWQSNIFGKSFHELVGEDLNAKVKRMPEDAREKLRETLQRIINEGSGGLICIIL